MEAKSTALITLVVGGLITSGLLLATQSYLRRTSAWWVVPLTLVYPLVLVVLSYLADGLEWRSQPPNPGARDVYNYLGTCYAFGFAGLWILAKKGLPLRYWAVLLLLVILPPALAFAFLEPSRIIQVFTFAYLMLVLLAFARFVRVLEIIA